MSRRGEERGRAVNEDRTVDQARIVRALSRPEAFPWPSGDVIVHETHGSWVFVAGDRAAKLKKSVKTPFFDYSTVERRRELCRREVEINRELAPEIYLGTRAVVDEGGAVRVASQEDDELEGALDTLVIMRRIHPEQLLDAHVREGRASEREIDAVVDLLVPFYERARADASIARHGTPEAVLAPVIGNFAETEHLVGRHTSEERFARLKSAQLGFVTLYRDLFERRVEEGRIREGHGDLRTEHVAFLPHPVIIDRIEFSEAFRSGDVASDLAFLRMDLEFRGAPRLATYLVERFVDRTGDRDLPRLVDFYSSYRAHVRAKVDAILLDQASATDPRREELDARVKRYFELAAFHTLGFHEPLLILVGGRSGSGKSTVARALAAATGAVLLRSDVIRKKLAGIPAEERADAPWGEGIYTVAFTRRTYDAIASEARRYLEAGATVIVDATFSREADRARFLELATETGARSVMLECRVPREVALARLAERKARGTDPSDAGPELYLQQEAHYESPAFAEPIDTTASKEEVDASVLRALRARVKEPC